MATLLAAGAGLAAPVRPVAVVRAGRRRSGLGEGVILERGQRLLDGRKARDEDADASGS